MKFKCICGKEFEKKITLSNHQRACKEFHKGKTYICECGKEFDTPAKKVISL